MPCTYTCLHSLLSLLLHPLHRGVTGSPGTLSWPQTFSTGMPRAGMCSFSLLMGGGNGRPALYVPVSVPGGSGSGGRLTRSWLTP